MQNYFFLTFDLEEFNLPLEYGIEISNNEMFLISYRGFSRILKILNKFKIKSTLFTTLNFGQRFPRMIKKIANKGHEIGLHYSFNYKKSMNNILEQKKMLEDITGINIIGFRGHKLKIFPFKLLKSIGFKYDSSIHPTFVPGRYNYFSYPTESYINEGLLEIPISVTPLIRLPFSFLWFRNLAMSYTKFCILFSRTKRKFINMYFHPWEFINISNYQVPFYLKKNCGDSMVLKLEKFLNWIIERNFQVIKIKDFVESTKHSI